MLAYGRTSFAFLINRMHHVRPPYSDWRCSYRSSVMLPCHMSRLVWFSANSFTLKSWVGGHMLSLSIHQFTSTTITVKKGGGLTKRAKGKGGGSSSVGGQSCDPAGPTTARWPYRSVGVEVEMMWLSGDLQAQTKCKHENTGSVCTVTVCVECTVHACGHTNVGIYTHNLLKTE